VAQKFITDFWTAFLIGIAGFTIVVPTGNWQDWLYAVGLALANVIVSATRRAAWEVISGE
jgi:hypothetical protein